MAIRGLKYSTFCVPKIHKCHIFHELFYYPTFYHLCCYTAYTCMHVDMVVYVIAAQNHGDVLYFILVAGQLLMCHFHYHEFHTIMQLLHLMCRVTLWTSQSNGYILTCEYSKPALYPHLISTPYVCVTLHVYT